MHDTIGWRAERLTTPPRSTHAGGSDTRCTLCHKRSSLLKNSPCVELSPTGAAASGYQPRKPPAADHFRSGIQPEKPHCSAIGTRRGVFQQAELSLSQDSALQNQVGSSQTQRPVGADDTRPDAVLDHQMVWHQGHSDLNMVWQDIRPDGVIFCFFIRNTGTRPQSLYVSANNFSATSNLGQKLPITFLDLDTGSVDSTATWSFALNPNVPTRFPGTSDNHVLFIPVSTSNPSLTELSLTTVSIGDIYEAHFRIRVR